MRRNKYCTTYWTVFRFLTLKREDLEGRWTDQGGEHHPTFGVFHFQRTKTLSQHNIPISTMASLTMDAPNDMMMEDSNDEHNTEINLTNASTTIDPSVVSSRILQSASLQKEQAAANEQPEFPELSAQQASGNRVEYRRVRCPPHRYTPLREHWEQILTPLVEYLKLQVRRRMAVLYMII
jgi:hypothetical protein